MERQAPRHFVSKAPALSSTEHSRTYDLSGGLMLQPLDLHNLLACIWLDNIWERGLLTGLWLRDTEGEIHTTDLNVVFERGRPVQMVAILVLKSIELSPIFKTPVRCARLFTTFQLSCLPPLRRNGNASFDSWRDTLPPMTLSLSLLRMRLPATRNKGVQGRGRAATRGEFDGYCADRTLTKENKRHNQSLALRGTQQETSLF
eukprot:scaffold245643_cov35-Tisochrysis_lutea.AAC.1